MKGSTISDRELETWAAIKRADEAHAYRWEQHGRWGAPVIVTALAPEALEMRRILREFISRHGEQTTDPLVLRAVELLGFNLDPQQPLFPKWPTLAPLPLVEDRSREQRVTDGDEPCSRCNAEPIEPGYTICRSCSEREIATSPDQSMDEKIVKGTEG